MTSKTKWINSLETKLCRIANRSRQDQKCEFNFLMSMFTKENLAICFTELDGSKAVGIDQKTKDEYGLNLSDNLDSLIGKMKTMSYSPLPVKEVLIPKENGKFRPLGISTIEDKIVQLMFSKVLEAVYEPTFKDCSYGFRPNRNCHMAIKEVFDFTYNNNCKVVMDLDLENFFGSICHQKLVAILKMRIKDEKFLRYITRMLKSGILRDGNIVKGDEGTPQGSMASPVLANIFGHYAFDVWFESVVRPRLKNNAKLIRYCDDIVVIFCDSKDAERFLPALVGRTRRFSLKLNTEKTKVLDFSKWKHNSGLKQGTFDFLGFTFYIGKSSKGISTTKIKTSGKRMRSKLKNMSIWWRRNRNKMELKALWKIFHSKIQGHINYYAITWNSQVVENFIFKAKRIAFKWINKRSQRRSMSWELFHKFEILFPLPKVKIKFRTY